MILDDQISFTQGDQNWQKYRQRALSDLYYFAGVVLGLGDLIPVREGPHRLLCKFVEKRTGVPPLDTAKFRKIEMPRGAGKTSLVTQAYTIQRICADPNISILLANEKEQNAKDFLAAIKYQFETNEFLRTLFPEVIPQDLNDTTWSASRIIVKRTTGRQEPTVFVIGVGGTVTGMHPDLIIVDDCISREAMENARMGSWQIMHQVNRWIHQLEPLLNPNALPFPEVIFIGTRWWHRDSYEHIEEAFGYGEPRQSFQLRWKMENGEILQVPAYRVGDLAVFRRAAIEDGRSIFPEKWDLETLAKIRVRDEVLFACSYLNNPSDEITATFRESWVQPYDWLDDRTTQFTDGSGAKKQYRVSDLDVLIFVDPGGFGVRQVEDRSRAALVATGSTLKGEHLVLDVWSEKDTFLACIKKIIEWAARYGPRRVVIEQAGQQASFVELVRQSAATEGTQFPVEVVKPGTKAKERRILGLEPYFQRGQMFLNKRARWYHEFAEQYRQFPRSGRLDVLDALAYGPQFWRRQPTSAQRDPARRREEELKEYYVRRGLPV